MILYHLRFTRSLANDTERFRLLYRKLGQHRQGSSGEFVVIKDSAIQGYFKDEAGAFEYMKGSEHGTFIVKKCQLPGTDVINYYNSQVAFV